MSTPELFSPEEGKQDSPKLAWIKRRGILTHFSAQFPKWQWIAILPTEDDRNKDIGTIMAESCRLYDEAGRVGDGETEDEAICELARKCGLPLWNEETVQ